MARSTIVRLDKTTEKQMRNFFQTLTEKDRRRYAAMEARRLGHGGIAYASEVLGCSTRTINRGLKELDGLPSDPVAGRIRRPGAGRKKRFSPALRSNRT